MREWGCIILGIKVLTYVGFGPPDISDAPIGAIYIDKDANKIEMLNSEKKWAHMANYGEYKTTAAKNKKNITNCPNCGAKMDLKD